MSDAVIGMLGAIAIFTLGHLVVRALVAWEMRHVPRCVDLPLSRRLMCLKG